MYLPIGTIADEFYHLKVQFTGFTPGPQRCAEALRLRARGGDTNTRANQKDNICTWLVEIDGAIQYRKNNS